MTGFTEQQARYTQLDSTPTFGDYARTLGAGFFDFAASAPQSAAYLASTFNGPEAEDYEYAASRLGEIISGVGGDLREMNTEAAQRITGAAFGSEDFFNHPFHWGLLNATQTAGGVAGAVIAGMVGGPTAGLLITSGMAGMQSAGMTYNDMVKDLDTEYQAGHLDNNPLFRSLVDSGMSEQDALKQFKQQAIGAKPAVLFALTAAAARFSPQGMLISKLRPTAGAAAARAARGPGLFARVGEGIAAGGTEEALQNTAEDLASQDVRVSAGLQKEYDPQRLAQALGAGFVVGGALGGVAGIPRGAHGALPLDEEGDTAPRYPHDVDMPIPESPEVRPAQVPPGPDITVPDQEAPREPWDPPPTPGSGATTSRAAPPPMPFGALTPPVPETPVLQDRVDEAVAAAIDASAAGVVIQKPSSRFRARGVFPPTPGEVPGAGITTPEPTETTAPTETPAPTTTTAARPTRGPKTTADIAPTTSTLPDNAALLTEPAAGVGTAPEVTPTTLDANQAFELVKNALINGETITRDWRNANDVSPSLALEVFPRIRDEGWGVAKGANQGKLSPGPAALAAAGGTTSPTEAVSPEVQAQAQGIVPPEPSLTPGVSPPEVPPVEPIPAPEGAATAAPVAVKPTAKKRTRKRPEAKPAETVVAPELPVKPVVDPRVQTLLDADPELLGPLQHWPANIAELDAMGADPKTYQKIMSTGSKEDLKKGETWREKALSLVERRLAREQAKRVEKPPATKKGRKGKAAVEAGARLKAKKTPKVEEAPKPLAAEPWMSEKERQANIAEAEANIAAEEKKAPPQRKKGTIKLTPRVKEKVERSKAKAAGVKGEIITPKGKVRVTTKKGGARPAVRPESKPVIDEPTIELRAIEREEPEPTPAPRKRIPAVAYKDKYQTATNLDAPESDQFREAYANLIAKLPENQRPDIDKVERGHEVDGEFHPILEDISPEGVAKTRQIRKETKRRVRQQSEAAEIEDRRRIQAIAKAAGIDLPFAEPEDKSNAARKRRLDAVDNAAYQIFKRHGLIESDPTNLAKLKARVASIARDAADVLAAYRTQFPANGWGKKSTKSHKSAHTWLLHALELNQIWDVHGEPTKEKIRGFFDDEESTRRNPEGQEPLQRSRIEAGFKAPNFDKLKGESESGGVLEGNLAEAYLDPEDLDAYQEAYGRPARLFREEAQTQRQAPPAQPLADHFRPRGVKLKAGRTVPRTRVETKKAKDAIDAAAAIAVGKLLRGKKPLPKNLLDWLRLSDSDRAKKMRATKAGNVALAEAAARKDELMAQRKTEARAPSLEVDTTPPPTIPRVFTSEVEERGKQAAKEYADLKAKADAEAAAEKAEKRAATAASINTRAEAATETHPVVLKIGDETVRITNPRGSERKISPRIKVKLKAHYGEFTDAKGVDGQPLDAYVGPNPESDTVFVIRQMKPGKPGKGPVFDENKVMLAFLDKEDAEAAYRGSVPKNADKRFTTEVLSSEEFRKWKSDPENTATGDNLNSESQSQQAVEKSQKKSQSIWDMPFTPRERVLQKRMASYQTEAEAIAEEAAATGQKLEDVAVPEEQVAEFEGQIFEGADTVEEAEPEIVGGVTAKGSAAAIAADYVPRLKEDRRTVGRIHSPFAEKVTARVVHISNVKDILAQANFADVYKGITGRKAALGFLRNRLIAAVGKMDVYILHGDDFEKFMGKHYVGNQGFNQFGAFVYVPGEGDPGDGYIVLNGRLNSADGRLITEIQLHEAVHGATYAALQRDPRLRSHLETLMGDVMRHHNIIDPKAHHGFTNAEEFLAVGMTDPAFQEMLASTPLSKRMATQLGIKQSGLINAWHGFLDFIHKALNLPRGNLTVMHAIVHATEKLMRDTEAGPTIKSGTPGAAAYRRASTPQSLHDSALRAIREARTGEGRQKNMSVPKLIKLATLDALARTADRFWGTDNNPIRKIYRYLTNISEQTGIFEKQAEKLINQTVKAEKEANPEVWHELWSVMSDEQTYNVFADRSLASQKHLGKDPVGNPTLKGAQAAANHAELEARLNRLPENLKKLRLNLYSFMEERQRMMAHLLIHNMLVEGLRGEKTAADISDALVERILNRELTDDDKKFIGNDDLLTRVVRAKELYHTAGPYFPKMRRGNWVVRAKLKVDAPVAALNGTLKDGTDNVYEFHGPDGRARAIEYAQSLEEKAWVSGITVDEKTGESWEVLPDDSEMPGTRHKLTMDDPGTVRVFRVEVQNEHVDFFESKADAEREAYALNNEADMVPGSVKDVQQREFSPGDRGVEFQSSDLTLAMKALEKRQGFKDMHPSMQHELRMAVQEFGLQMMGSTRVHKRRIQRRHVSGESADISRNLVDYAHSTSSYLARLDFAQEMNDALREMKSSIGEGAQGTGQGRRAIANEVLRRIDGGNGFDQGNKWYSPLVQRLLTTSFIARLGSPMYTMMNLLQVGMVSMPVIAARHGIAQTTRAMTKAYRDIGAGSILLKGIKETYRKAVDPTSETETFLDGIRKNLSSRERDVLQYITQRGGLEISKLVKSGKGYDTALAWGEGISRQLPTAAEVINRAVVLLTAYRLEYAKNGGNHAAALQYADDTNNMTNFNYSEINAPPTFNHPLAKISFQFKRFGHGMYQLLGQQIGRAVRNENPGDRAEALKSLAYIVATHTLMAGTLGLPTEIPKALVIGLFAAGVTGFNWQDFENAERELAADLLGPDLGEALTRGVTRTLPFGLAFDLSTRVGMADMFLSREPNSGQPNDIKNWLMEMAFGAPGSMVADFQKGARQLIDGDYAKAAQNLTPVKGLRDIIRAVDTAMVGKKTATGRPSMAPYGIAEAFVRALGATPEREAETQELQAQFYSQQAYINQERGKLERRWAEGSTADRIRMRGALERFNRGKPEEAQLKAKDLNAYVKRQKTDIGGMIGGVTTNRGNRYVIERGQGVYNAQ